jgi:hypothetical protein
MFWKNIEIHNAAELVDVDGGVMPVRYPLAMKPFLNESAQNIMFNTAHTELRFVATGDKLPEITLSTTEPRQAYAVIFRGQFCQRNIISLTTKPQVIKFQANENLSKLSSEYTSSMAFSPNVWRVVISEQPIILHDVQGGCRPPQPDELPRRRYLTYGTSITHGASAMLPHLSYAAQAARRLDADLINLGLGGACHCEKEIADWIAGRDDWDFATLSLSVNMTGKYTIEEFEDRVSYMVNKVAMSDLSRPVSCITLFPHFRDIGVLRDGIGPEKTDAMRQVLRDIVAAYPHDNLILLEGPELLDDLSGLTEDLIHPSDYGMTLIAEHLVARLRPFLSGFSNCR